MQNILVAFSYFPFVFYGIVYVNPCKKYIEQQPIYFYLSYRVVCVYSPYTIVEM